MNGEWDAWLRRLAADMQGGSDLALPSIVRGLPYSAAITFAANYSANAWAGGLRVAPDAGAVLVSFTVSAGSYTGGTTTVTFSLTDTQTAALPADGDGDGLVQLVFELRRTPTGLGAIRAAAGVVSVSGRGG